MQLSGSLPQPSEAALLISRKVLDSLIQLGGDQWAPELCLYLPSFQIKNLPSLIILDFYMGSGDQILSSYFCKRYLLDKVVSPSLYIKSSHLSVFYFSLFCVNIWCVYMCVHVCVFRRMYVW